MSEYVAIFRSLINGLPTKATVLVLSAAVVGLTLWVASELSALETVFDARITPVEEAVGEQTQMLRYLACVDRRGGPEEHVRENCANDHLSDTLRDILGGT